VQGLTWTLRGKYWPEGITGEYRKIFWNTLEYIGIHWKTLEYIGIHWNPL
jgi:hypothetical protein